MIIFHEGLPGSGKSYEAALNQVIPALKKGRQVYAYIEGLNHEKFAEVTGLPVKLVESMLHQITKEQVQEIYKHVKNDSLVIIDELQDFFPAGKASLSKEITEFVTQHRHRGLDIVCMGQDHRDCHMLWKRRIDTLMRFVKRDAIGQPNSYTWSTFKLRAGKFEPLRTGKGGYDKANFGLYASHSTGVESIDAHQDDRTNVFKSAAFTLWVPLFLVVLGFSGYYLWGFFHGKGMINVPEQSKAVPIAPISPYFTASKSEVKPDVKPEIKLKQVAREYSSFLEKLLEENRPRLAAILQSTDKKRLIVKVDFYQDGSRVNETFGLKELQEFGYAVDVKAFGIVISKGEKHYPVTAWPLDIQRNYTKEQEPSLGHDETKQPA